MSAQRGNRHTAFLISRFQDSELSYKYPSVLQISLRGSIPDLGREKCLLPRSPWHSAERWQPTCQPQMSGPGAASA